jgi:hypothetical protein
MKVKLTILVLALLVLVVTAQSRQTQQTKPNQPGWEYRMQCGRPTQQIIGNLNSWGNDGWELVSITVDPQGGVGLNRGASDYCYWFKRPKL